MDKLDAITAQLETCSKIPSNAKPSKTKSPTRSFFLLRFADLNRIDLPAALSSKLMRNGKRYPINTSSAEYRKAGHRE